MEIFTKRSIILKRVHVSINFEQFLGKYLGGEVELLCFELELESLELDPLIEPVPPVELALLVELAPLVGLPPLQIIP